MPQSPSTRETEYEFYVRAAADHARTLRRERRARVIHKLTSLRASQRLASPRTRNYAGIDDRSDPHEAIVTEQQLGARTC